MPATLMSIAEFESLPEMPGKQELLQGEPIILPPAKRTHHKIVQAMYRLLGSALAADVVCMEAGYQMSRDTWLQPDVSVTWPDQRVANDYFQGAPMIAIEIVSPGNTPTRIEKKVAAYLRYGAAEVWIVYPETSSMMVHKTGSVENITGIYQSDLVPVAVSMPDILAV